MGKLSETLAKLPDLLVEHAMNRNLVTVKPEQDLETAARLMSQNRIRHLPVVDGSGKLVGVVTHRDILRYSVSRWGGTEGEAVLNAVAVSESMKPDPKTTTPQDLLKDAARTLCENQIGCLPVVDDRGLVGVLTETDFVALFAQPI